LVVSHAPVHVVPQLEPLTVDAHVPLHVPPVQLPPLVIDVTQVPVHVSGGAHV
jgi:hypothetical protein